jgi:ribose transport system permease protein
VSDGPRFRWKDLTVYLGFALVFAFFAVTIGDKGFLSAQNATSIISQVTPIALMAFGAVFVLTAGEIDLSIGSVVATGRCSPRSGCGTMGSFPVSPSES